MSKLKIWSLGLMVSTILVSCGDKKKEKASTTEQVEFKNLNKGVKPSANFTKSEDGTFEYQLIGNHQGKLPQNGDQVTFNYKVKNGTKVLQSSEKSGPGQAIIPLEKDLNFFSLPLTYMAAEDSVIIRAKVDEKLLKAMGPGSSSPFQLGDTMYMEFKMLKIRTKEEAVAERNALIEAAKAKTEKLKIDLQTVVDKYNAGDLTNFKKLPSGLLIYMHKAGNGAIPTNGANIIANYHGVLVKDGKKFDSSYERGEPFSFPLGQGNVIKGWDEGFGKLRIGSEATLIIPAQLAYGSRSMGNDIPANSTLAFYVELVDAK